MTYDAFPVYISTLMYMYTPCLYNKSLLHVLKVSLLPMINNGLIMWYIFVYTVWVDMIFWIRISKLGTDQISRWGGVVVLTWGIAPNFVKKGWYGAPDFAHKSWSGVLNSSNIFWGGINSINPRSPKGEAKRLYIFLIRNNFFEIGF